MSEETALWLPSKRARLSLGPASTVEPGRGEVAVRTRAVAVNPFDRYIQNVGDVITPYLRYPLILGTDVAGEVVAVGDGVTRLKPGDRVVGFAAGAEKTRNRSAEGAFQSRVVLMAHMTAPLPDDLSFEAAAVLPLGISTAACALFQRDFLACSPPSLSPTKMGQTVVVWGGSTSVGSNAIQLAVAAGYDVVATASPRNFDYVRRLGAKAAFDYRDSDVVRELIAAVRTDTVAGAVAIGPGSAKACIDILARSAGKRFVAMVTPPASFADVPRGRGRWWKLAPVLAGTVTGNAGLTVRGWRRGVAAKFVWGGALIDNEVGPMIFEQFLPAALGERRYVAAPPAEIVGDGLDAIPGALDRQHQGVSARKIVVRI